MLLEQQKNLTLNFESFIPQTSRIWRGHKRPVGVLLRSDGHAASTWTSLDSLETAILHSFTHLRSEQRLDQGTSNSRRTRRSLKADSHLPNARGNPLRKLARHKFAIFPKRTRKSQKPPATVDALCQSQSEARLGSHRQPLQ